MDWILAIEIDDEWEYCRFPERREALTAFAALFQDYSRRIGRAVLADAKCALRWSRPVTATIQ